MPITEPLTLTALKKGKSRAADCRVRPARRAERERRPARQARGLDTPPLRYEVASLQHWLDLNA
jgi:hypothetical protein